MTIKTKGGESRPASLARTYESKWLQSVPFGERERWKTLSILERCRAFLATVDNIDSSVRAVGVDRIGINRFIFRGFRSLREHHPTILDAWIRLDDDDSALSALYTYGSKGETALWSLIHRIDDVFTADHFVRLYSGISSTAVVAVVALPSSAMLRRASEIAPQLTNAFHFFQPARAIPSAFFPGIVRRLDNKIIEAGLETDVELLSELATYQGGDQDIFWGMLPDRAAASRYVRTAQWRRPLLNYSDEVQEVWDLFKLMCGDFDNLARSTKKPSEWTPEDWRSAQKSLGISYQSVALKAFSKRWPMAYQVIWGYGKALQHGPVPTDEERRVPPWKT